MTQEKQCIGALYFPNRRLYHVYDINTDQAVVVSQMVDEFDGSYQEAYLILFYDVVSLYSSHGITLLGMMVSLHG